MSGDVHLELWLHEYKMHALSAVLEEQSSSVEAGRGWRWEWGGR